MGMKERSVMYFKNKISISFFSPKDPHNIHTLEYYMYYRKHYIKTRRYPSPPFSV